MEQISIEEMVQTYGKKVYNLAYRLIGNKQDAEDITQETFLQVYRSLDKFRGESAIYTWIYRIAVNNSLQRAKSNLKSYFSDRCQWIPGGESTCSCRSRIGFALAYAPDILKHLRNYEQDINTRNLIHSTLQNIPNIDTMYQSLPVEDHKSDMLVNYLRGA